MNVQQGPSTDRAHAHVQFLTGLGPRLAGTATEAIAASYIENEFRSYGLDTWTESFVIENSYVVEESRLSVLQPMQIDLTCIPVIYSPSRTVTGQLAYVSDVHENRDQLREHVVLIEKTKLSRELVDLPPLAILTYLEDMPAISEIWPNPPKVPIVWISGRDALELIKLLEQDQVEVELRLATRTERGTSYNVVARLPSESDEAIVVNAHHDSMLTPGAVDDASGIAVVLEIARVLSSERLKGTVIFATFGGEELGLFGSTNFLSKHKGDEIAAAITFDCIGAGPENGLRIGLKDSPQYTTTEWLDDYVQRVAENLGFYAQSEHLDAVGGYSDYASFVKAGILATWVCWVNPEYGYDILGPVHTLSDDLDAIDKIRLQQVASIGVEVVRRLAGKNLEARLRAHEFPVRAAAFTVISVGAIILAIGICCFAHHRRGWTWGRAAWVLSLVAGAAIALAYLLILV